MSGTKREASVVIVGGGFAGVACAKYLGKHKVAVTLVDRHNYNQFQPLLYQIASAQVNTTDVARPLRAIFRKHKCVTVKVADVVEVDPATRTVTSADGVAFSGDYLVLAMGGEANFFGTPGAAEHAFPLYALDDAERLRSRLLAVLEAAYRNPKLVDQGALNFVIVGAGATGVETAGALADVLNRLIPKRLGDVGIGAAQIYVVDPGSVVLAPFSDRVHAYARKALEDRHVKLEFGVKVNQVRADRVVLSDGREILTRAVVWAGGIQASGLVSRSSIEAGPGGRIGVEPDLTVKAFPGVYALGDVANTPGPDGKPFPQLGSVALQAGRRAAENILADIDGKPRSDFTYRDKGIMAMIGRNAAVAEVGPKRRELHGVLAYVSWLGVHAALLSGFRERANALASWGWDYLFSARASAIIDRPEAAAIDWNE
jgi:NADH:quinone reductase (non-electrogenic)